MAHLHSAFVYNCSWIQHLKFVQTAGSDDHVTGAVVWVSLTKTLATDTVTKFCVMKLQKSSPLVPFGTFYDILEWYNRTVPKQTESKLQGFISPNTLFSWIDASRICRQSGMNLMYFTNMEHLAKMLFYKDPAQSFYKICNVTQVEAIFVQQGFGQKVFETIFFIHFLDLLFHTCGVNVSHEKTGQSFWHKMVIQQNQIYSTLTKQRPQAKAKTIRRKNFGHIASCLAAS